MNRKPKNLSIEPEEDKFPYDKDELEKLLKEGAIENAERDLQIAQEWFPLEQEAWEKIDQE